MKRSTENTPVGFEERQHGDHSFLYALFQHDCTDPLQKIILSHWHRAFEIIMMERGQGTFRIGGESVLLKQGEYVVISPGMLHSGTSDDRSLFCCLLFHPSLFAYAPHTANSYYTGCIEPLITGKHVLSPLPRIQSAGFRLCQQAADTIAGDAGELCIVSHLYLLLDTLLNQHDTISAIQDMAGCPNLYIRQAVDYINSHYQEDITSAGLAERLNVSLPYFCRTFSSQVGVSPLRYLHTVRVRAAQALLSDEALPIAEIAEHCGFSDAGYFSRIFRHLTGVSPSAYRESNPSR